MSLSSFERSSLLTRLRSENYDVLVIGGGITGVGIALDAASRGLKTALIEKNDFAFGTSSRSTKLIHGGLRYLKQLEFALVKEVGSERAIVHQLAPHLVVPEKMLLPLYETKGLGYWLASVGLKIYDWLAGVPQEDRRKMLTKPQTVLNEPLLKPDDIKGGALYAEYRTDDARLTIEIAKRAGEKGAVLVSYMRATGFNYTQGRITGLTAADEITQEGFDISAAVIVNAAGPWVDELRELDKSRTGKFLHLTKGVHVVVPYHRLPVRQAIYFDVPDGRMIFAIPRGRVTYIGTTDTEYKGSKDRVVTTAADARYLIEGVNETFPSVHLTLADVESSWAGLRPLIHEEGKSASELSRKDEIFESGTGLISIAGGKLTGYRKMAERVVDRIIETNFEDRKVEPCHTDTLFLGGGRLGTATEVDTYTRGIARQVEALGLKGVEGSYLVHLYGKQADLITQYCKEHPAADPEIGLALAELWFALHHERIVRLPDFLIRRTGLLYFNMHRLLKIMEPILKSMAESLGWDDVRKEKERALMMRLIEDATTFNR
ncbi:MAG: glycerol-3-phosphate dehydrogenase/oxidase [Cytophagales bacterium]|nr:glycerol-3-phosphate dehydrogenase/oxidase [Cytophagales bacterium]